MIIHIKAFANFRDILGRDSQVDLMEGSTIKELLDNLSASHQRLRSAIFDESGKVREYVVIMKNRKDIVSLDGLQTALSESDEVAILPPVAGG
ncbi:Small archaeal modifier protein 3 [uncultured archaeon]|nr:Small archaeal modifier protein 3 [uncultured archaeon]